MALLTNSEIEAADDRRFEIVPVPEWGGEVRVRSLDEGEYDDFQDSIYKQRGKNVETNLKVVRIRLCSLCIVNVDGKTYMTEDALKKKSAKNIGIVMKVAMRLNGMDDSDVEELAKNSESAPGGASSSN